MRKNILFDLDGTLTDPQVGIIRCIQHALKLDGRPVPTHEELLWCIGPPLNESMAKLAQDLDKDGVWRLVLLYRERFASIGLFENGVYPEIRELVAQLSERHALYVATSKPQVYARQIMDHYDLSQYFRAVYGSELDYSRSDKGELINYILAKEEIAPADALIVGDRLHDVRGAKIAGILSVGITWGYGSRAELEGAGADFVVDSVGELGQLLLSRAGPQD